MVSAVVLTQGVKNLDKCLKSLSFCDEVIVIKNQKITDFSAVRNSALKKVKNEWVLFVDDDERVSEDLKKEISQVLSDSKKNDYHGYYLKRKNLFLGKVAGEDKILRLARKNSGKWQRIVHEEWKVRGKLGELNGYLIHETARSVKEAIFKTNFYSSLHAEQNLKEEKRSNLFKIIFFPPAKLLQNVMTSKGFVFGLLHSLHSFLAWSKLWLLQTRGN